MIKRNLFKALIPIVIALIFGGGRSGHGFELLEHWPVPNDSVRTIVSDPANNRVIVGGQFDRLGPMTGGFVGLSPTNAEWVTPGMAKVTGGGVTQVHPDGNGGWIIAGNFTAIDGVPRSGMARILADGSLDPDWDPSPNSDVFAIAVRAPLVFIGGSFTEISGVPRNRIAALSLVGGEVADWDPGANATVNCLTVDGDTLYVGGQFTIIGGADRARLAALNVFSGIPTSWDPAASGSVNTILLDGGELLVGGSFTTVGGQTRNRIAALNLTTGLATAWNPNASNIVNAVAVAGSNVYLGGNFSNVSGQSRPRLAAVDRTTGAVSAWQPNPDAEVTDLAIDGGTLYAVGRFETIGGQNRPAVAAIDTGTGLASSWDAGIGENGQVFAIQATDDSTIFLGTSQATIGGVTRNGLAAIDVNTGELTAWNPDLGDGVVFSAILSADGTLYFGGLFEEVGGVARENLAAVNSAGVPTSWNPGANDAVYAIADGGNSVFVGGNFDVAGALARENLAEIGKGSAVATAWNPAPSSSVWAIIPTATSVFVGGNFSSIGGQGRDMVAQVDRISGLATGLDGRANFPGTVFALALDGANLIYGGTFKDFQHDSLQLAAVNVNTGQPVAWPTFTGIDRIETIVADGTRFLMGGFLSVPTVEGTIANSLAVFDPVDGSFSEVDPAFGAPTGTTNAVLKVGTKLVIGGFLFGLGDGRQFLGAYETAVPPAPTPSPQPTPQPTATPRPTPSQKVTLKVSGRKKLATTKKKVVLKGTYAGGTRVQYRVGNGKFRSAKTGSSKWRATIPLKPGRNVVTIRVEGPGGSQMKRVTITKRPR